MRYALVENGVVTSIIWLYPGNASDFPNAVALGDRPVGIGDLYADGVFTRNGVEVQTEVEMLSATVAELDGALIEAEFALLTTTEEGGESL